MDLENKLPAIYIHQSLATVSNELQLMQEVVNDADAEKWFKKGLKAEEVSNWEEALYCFQQAERLDPYWFKYLLKVSFCFLKLGSAEKFTSSLYEVIVGKHYTIETLTESLTVQKWLEVESFLLSIFSLSETNKSRTCYTVVFLFTLYHKFKTPEWEDTTTGDVIEILKENFKLQRGDVPDDLFHFIKALSYEKEGFNHKLSLEEIEKAISINDAKSLYYHSRLLINTYLHDISEESTYRWIAQDDVKAAQLNSMELEYHKYSGDIMDCYKNLIENYPARADFYFERGKEIVHFLYPIPWEEVSGVTMADENGYREFFKALEDFEKACVLEPDNPEYLYFKGYIKFKIAEWELKFDCLKDREQIFIARDIMLLAIDKGYTDDSLFKEYSPWGAVMEKLGYTYGD